MESWKKMKMKCIRPSKYFFAVALLSSLVCLLGYAYSVPKAFSQEGTPMDSPLAPQGVEAETEPGVDGPPPRSIRERLGERRRRGGRDQHTGKRMDRSRAGRGGHSRRGALHAKAKFLEFSSQYIESVQDPYQALGFAAIGIKVGCLFCALCRIGQSFNNASAVSRPERSAPSIEPFVQKSPQT